METKEKIYLVESGDLQNECGWIIWTPVRAFRTKERAEACKSVYKIIEEGKQYPLSYRITEIGLE